MKRTRAKLKPVLDDVLDGRPVDDREFDDLYPAVIRGMSSDFWTPVDVARRAAALLVGDLPHARVLDVGAGVGKLCAIGALTTRASFTGVEQRRYLVEHGRHALEVLGISSVSLLHATIEDIDWCEYDAYYFYNPFEENVYASIDRLDNTVDLSEQRFWRDVTIAETALDRAPLGTRVVTYHGFGGRIPFTYEQEHIEKAGSNYLRVWVKTKLGRSLHAGRLEGLLPGLS